MGRRDRIGRVGIGDGDRCRPSPSRRGVFLCVSLSDLLPELQFHSHDRGSLSVALLLGLALAWGVHQLESSVHHHDDEAGEHEGHEGHNH